jgi:hypothetical protein
MSKAKTPKNSRWPRLMALVKAKYLKKLKESVSKK